MNLMTTPWGAALSVDHVAPGICRVSTMTHSGYGVHIDTPMPHALAAVAVATGDTRWFEGDFDAACVVLSFPSLFTPPQQARATRLLADYRPATFAAHFGRMPTRDESLSVRKAILDAQLASHYRPTSRVAQRWDIPDGFLYVTGHRAVDDSDQGFLVPADSLRGKPTDEIVLDGFPQWRPNTGARHHRSAGGLRHAVC